jgi:hypothetical protein
VPLSQGDVYLGLNGPGLLGRSAGQRLSASSCRGAASSSAAVRAGSARQARWAATHFSTAPEVLPQVPAVGDLHRVRRAPVAAV